MRRDPLEPACWAAVAAVLVWAAAGALSRGGALVQGPEEVHAVVAIVKYNLFR